MRFAFVAAVVVAGCSGGGGGGGGGDGGGAQFKVGDSCTGDAVCTDAKNSLWCEGKPDGGGGLFGNNGTFRAYECLGVNGCTSNASRTVCDWTGNSPDSGCPEQEAGKGFCRPDAGDLLRCDAAKWTAHPCPNCREQSGQILCN